MVSRLLFASLLSLLTALGGSGTPALLAQTGKKITFDVVSIRPTPPGADIYKGGGWGTSPDGYFLRIVSLYSLVMNAYFPMMDRTPDPIKNAPSWLRQNSYNVEARVAPEDVPAWSNLALSAAQRNEMVQGALQALLADRLKLVAHREPIETDGYALIVSKHGSKLKEITPDTPTAERFMKMGDGGAGVWTATEGRSGYWTFYHTSIGEMRLFLQGGIFKPIVDQTGLSGKYHFAMMPQQFDPADHPAEDGSDRFDLGQLGLELKPIKVKTFVLVIDHIEKPSDN